jgi:single-stranded-DNA-specific exonuclease
LTSDEGEAGVFAMKLEKLNRERQEVVAENMDTLRVDFGKKELDNILLLKNEKWTAGIIGLIAGRISEEYSRPVFCMAEESGIIKGSVRSSVDLNVIETLRVFENIFINYGGHHGAGGFSLKSENFELFQEQIMVYANEKMNKENMVVGLKIDKELSFGEINQELYGKIKRFEPFGRDNEEPLFVTYGVKVKEAKKVGKENTHTKLKLTHDGKEFGAILFNHGEIGDQLYYGKDLDIVYKINENEWRDKKSLELKIEDLKL